MMKTLQRIALVFVAIMLIDMNVPSDAQAGACCNAFNVLRSPVPSNVLASATYIDAKVLLANTSQTQTVPTGANWVVFSATCNFYAQRGASASVPAATISNGSSPQVNPSAWNVTDITQLTLIADTNCTVTLAFYS